MEYFGLLPAAGLALRMRPFRYPKELLPVHFQETGSNEFIRPKLLIEYSLDAFSLADINKIYIVVPDWKPEILRYLGDGGEFNSHISYLYNSKAAGLADALLTGYPWLQDKITCFAMPDTMFSPATAFQDIIEVLNKHNADLVLGVFPTDEPEHFAPVEFDKNGIVLGVEEKPSSPRFNNTYGIAVWNKVFWEFFETNSSVLASGVSVTETFHQAAKHGLNVRCVYFADGWYKDVGRINNISKFST